MGILSFPDQTIPESKKGKQFHIDVALSRVSNSRARVSSSQHREILKYYRGYNAELSAEEAEKTKAITCPHGTDLGVEYIVYPLIQGKIEQVVGEYMLRPSRRKAYVTDKKSKAKKYDEKLKMLGEELMRDLTKKMEGELGFTPDTENPEMEIPEDVEEFFEKDFKTLGEETVDKLITFLLDVRKEKVKFKELFLDYCISDRAHAVLDKKNGHTTIRKVHPLDAEYDLDPYKVVQDDHEYFFEDYYITENEIYNSFPNLTKKQKSKVSEIFKNVDIFNDNENSEGLSGSNKYDGWVSTSNKINRLRVVSAMWKSSKRVSVKKSITKRGDSINKKVDENYKPRKKDKIEHIDGEMPRFVIMLGPEICLDWGIMKQRMSSIAAPWHCTLPVVSIVRENSTGSSLIKSMAAKLYQLQQLASEIMFEIRLAMKSAGNSRVLVYDAAQTPKAFSKGSFDTGLNRVMHHVKRDKMMVINSKDKGASKNTFNQFTSLDMSQKGAIQDLFNGLAIIEDLGSKFSGISPEREGQVGQYQTASGTDKAIRGSSARTETTYTPFDEFVQALLDKMILKAKQDYEPGSMIQYVIGEMRTKFLKIYKDVFESDFGIYLSDGRKDKENSERINQAAELALSNSNTPEMVMGLIDIFEKETAVEKKQVFQKMLDSMQELQAQAAKAEQESAQMEAQAAARKDAEEVQLKREGFENNIDVAEIYVAGKSQSDVTKAGSQEKIKAAELSVKQQEAAAKKEDK